MARRVYSEGDWFLVPLGNRAVVGLIARAPEHSKVLLAYLFKYSNTDNEHSQYCQRLRAQDALSIEILGNLFLHNKKWPVVCHGENWHRRDWPMPQFVREEPISDRTWLVECSDDDPLKVVSEERLLESDQSGDRPVYRIAGAGAVEARLRSLIESDPEGP